MKGKVVSISPLNSSEFIALTDKGEVYHVRTTDGRNWNWTRLETPIQSRTNTGCKFG